jgi:hypothetical protein
MSAYQLIFVRGQIRHCVIRFFKTFIRITSFICNSTEPPPPSHTPNLSRSHMTLMKLKLFFVTRS